jgi:hypothetical protein
MRSTFSKHFWFLFGERLPVAGVIVTIAPAAYAIWLLRRSEYWTGALIFVAWFPLFLLLITAMQRKGIVRIWLSLSATAAVLLAIAGAVVFALLAWVRAHVPSSMESYLLVTISASLAPWAVPGAIVGFVVPRRALLVGAILGLVTGAALAVWQDGAVDYCELRDLAIKSGWGILFCGSSAWTGTRLRSLVRARQATSVGRKAMDDWDKAASIGVGATSRRLSSSLEGTWTALSTCWQRITDREVRCRVRLTLNPGPASSGP